MNIKPLTFQVKAIEGLLNKFIQAWKRNENHSEILLKSPTGSGKTFMVSSFVRDLNKLPNWDEDKAFIWITFSDEIAMQSREKFGQYFENNLENVTVTVNDLERKKLYKNDILFLNWQKIVSRAAENRVLRRPEDTLMQKESGLYFEDFIDNTHADKRNIVLIIDEAHKNTTTRLSQQIVNYINPRIILYVTATPTESTELECRRTNSMVEVSREEVVEEGLIKESIVVQTDENLTNFEGQDLDEILISLGMTKRDELSEEFGKIGKDINPLLLIQLPNDDKKLIDLGQKTKEQIVLDYLLSKGVKEDEIALWFDGKQKNMEYITENNSSVKYLLFKQAAGTGWDCPRAHVLIMFREISSAVFYVQTVGRILRMAEPKNKSDYISYPSLRTGYLFTNYKRDEVEIPNQSPKNQPLTKIAKKRFDTSGFHLDSEYIPRVDYGDLGSSSKFQKSFINSMNKYFGIEGSDVLGLGIKKLEENGVEINSHVTNQIIVDAKFTDYDNLAFEFKTKGYDINLEMSRNDIEKTFNYYCYKLLQEQTDEEAKITNISRSWSPLKSALRVWLKNVFSQESDYYYRVFINDLRKNASSKFRPAITYAIKQYKPLLEKAIEVKYEDIKQNKKLLFSIKDMYYYPDNYESRETKFNVLDKYCCPMEYKGKKNEDDFIEYLEDKEEYISWWFKNGDYGKDYFAISYFDTIENSTRLFYPDWIIKLKNGKTVICDTKSGFTLQTMDGKEKALADKLHKLGSEFIGGIVTKRNGIWWCQVIDLASNSPQWVEFEDVLKQSLVIK